MKILNFLIFICLLFFAAQASAQSSSPSQNRLIVVVYGDLLTSNTYLPHEQTFPAQLEKKLRDTGFEVSVTAMGETDLTTSTALEKINALIGVAPDIVILQLGETDIKRGFNPSNLISNIDSIIDMLKKRGIYVVVMGAKVPASNGEEYVKKISDYFFAMQKHTQLYPYTLEGVVGNEELTLGDSYRPNSRGVAKMVEGIYRMVDYGLRWKIESINKMRLKQQNTK